jgi:nickel-dependent lactate racemase
MPTIQLGYGHDSIDFEYDPARFEVLTTHRDSTPLSDPEIGAALDDPIESPPLEELIEPGDSVLIVASDATRATGSAQVVNLLVRRLIQNGIAPADIAIIFATGIHRAVRDEEKTELLTPFIAQRIRTIDHDAYDAANLIQIATMADGTPIEVNRGAERFFEVDCDGRLRLSLLRGLHRRAQIDLSGTWHQREPIEATHMLALDFERGGRRAGVGTGLLKGNAVSEECERVAALINPTFAVNTIVDESGAVENIFAGHWRTAHERACAAYASAHSTTISEKREVVIVSCGGLPYDINMIQAHKGPRHGRARLRDGGTIVLLAECADGLGRSDFLKWFDAENSAVLSSHLREHYEVNGQTAWALLTKTEKFRVHLVTALDDDSVRRMTMIPAQKIESVLATCRRTRPDTSCREARHYCP